MMILAKTHEGSEYMYSPFTAHMVSKASAEVVCSVLNKIGFQILQEKREKWHIYEVDQYDVAYDFAQVQKFTVRNGIVKRVTNRS